MLGETNLQKLLAELQPYRHDGEYVFVAVDGAMSVERQDVLCEFKEEEGVTLVLSRLRADALGLSYDFVAAWITLRIHSSLQAVGLTARIATALAEEQISCNVIAAYYHDHLFVDVRDAERAMQVLLALAKAVNR